jgi:purine-binding chemotaxis protein CheW
MHRFLTFGVAGRLYALGAETVSEVMRVPAYARVPLAPKALLGVANLRGTILPLVSLRVLLGLEDTGTAERAIVLDGGAALTVDGVDALVLVGEVASAESGAEAGEKLLGAFDTGHGVAKILDVPALLRQVFDGHARPERRAIAQAAIAQAAIGRAKESETLDRETLVTFDVAGQEFALALDIVQEIVPVPDHVAAMPRGDAPVVGMIGFRDELLPLLSLRGLLGFPAAGAERAREKIVVASVGGAKVGLIADRARAVVSADRRRIDAVPEVLAARTGGEARIKSIYRAEEGGRLVSILASDQLFREDVMQRLGARPGIAQPPRGAAGGAEQVFLVFRLGGDEFGLPIEAIDEVARVPAKITRVPKTPKFLEGVVNLRGEVIPVIDQRRRFDMPKLEQDEGRRLVIVRTERHRAGLIVDGVSEVLRTAEDAIAPPPDLTGDITKLVRGVITLEGTVKEGARIVLLLDPTDLLTRAERGLLDAFEARKTS